MGSELRWIRIWWSDGQSQATIPGPFFDSVQDIPFDFPKNSICVNTPGSFQCNCLSGYQPIKGRYSIPEDCIGRVSPNPKSSYNTLNLI